MKMRHFETPLYMETKQKGALADKIERARRLLSCCTLCPQACGVDRTAGEKGICNTGSDAVVYSFDAHFGEEAPLVGTGGSGTIFFSNCNMLCRFCQNIDISHQGEGRAITADQLAYMMLSLQKEGCHNINFVTPSHVVPQILSAIDMAVEMGLTIPLVYNTGGYDSVETLGLLDGVIDIYMPDIKCLTDQSAEMMGIPLDYPGVVKAAVKEMHRQVGDLVVVPEMGEMGRGSLNENHLLSGWAKERSIARRGLLVRHLVMPEGLADTLAVMRFLNDEVSPETYVNIMSQYRPCGMAREIPSLSRRITAKEYDDAIRTAQGVGITRLDR